jgi:hypothetical protein
VGEGGEEEMLGKICRKHFHTKVSSIVLFFVSSLLQGAAVWTTWEFINLIVKMLKPLIIVLVSKIGLCSFQMDLVPLRRIFWQFVPTYCCSLNS